MSEFSGTITNALERGWSIQEIRTSLLNAGYPQQEIDSELRNNQSQNTEIPQIIQTQNSKSLNTYQTPIPKPPKKRGILFLIIFLVLVLISSAVIGFLMLF